MRHARFCEFGCLSGNIPGKDDHRHPAPFDGRANGDVQNPWHLFRVRNQLTVVTALSEKYFRVRFLKVPSTDFFARNVGGNRDNGDPAPMTIIEAVDEMKVARTAASRTHRQLSG